VSGLLLAYPLYYQFRGPGHYEGQPFRPPVHHQPAVADRLPEAGVAGTTGIARWLSGSPTEEKPSGDRPASS